jgi:hypothetical protein
VVHMKRLHGSTGPAIRQRRLATPGTASLNDAGYGVAE